MSRGERLAYAWKSDQEQSDEIMENIVRALEEKDSSALLKQFSKRTQKEKKDLEKQIEGLMEYYQWERKEFKGDAATSEETEYGRDDLCALFLQPGIYARGTDLWGA